MRPTEPKDYRVLNTTANTNYNFHYHVQGVASMTGEGLGHTLIIGPSTSGKTSLMASLCLLSLRNPDTRTYGGVSDDPLGD